MYLWLTILAFQMKIDIAGYVKYPTDQTQIRKSKWDADQYNISFQLYNFGQEIHQSVHSNFFII